MARGTGRDSRVGAGASRETSRCDAYRASGHLCRGPTESQKRGVWGACPPACLTFPTHLLTSLAQSHHLIVFLELACFCLFLELVASVFATFLKVRVALEQTACRDHSRARQQALPPSLSSRCNQCPDDTRRRPRERPVGEASASGVGRLRR
eukprot:2555383-Prymnesium_polylepis.1